MKTHAQRIQALEHQVGELAGQKEVKTQTDGSSQKILESVCKRMEELLQAYANGGGREGVSLHSTSANHFASHSSQHTSKSQSDAGNLRPPRYNKRFRPPYHKIPEFEEQAKQRQLKGILNKLTPKNFERLLQQVKQVNIDNVITLCGLVSQIIDKALMEPTFCEMYANFCFHLAADLPDLSMDYERITFKRLLLNKCQEEFERGEREEEEANKSKEECEVKPTAEEREENRLKARRRMLGNIRFIGELYKKRFLTERIMHECINKLLGQCQNLDEENIEALCKLMSTIGEMIDHPKAKDHIDAYFEIMTQLSNNMRLSSRVRFMLKDAIDLRKNNWQQRKKVEGSEKVEEVHKDAAQERQAQSSRLSRAPSMGNSARRGPPMEYAPGSPSSPSPQSGGCRCFDRSLPDQSPALGGSPTSTQNASSDEVWPEERLRYKSLAAIREFYSANIQTNEEIFCFCVRQARLSTSWTKLNPGRRFFNCSDIIDWRDFFLWQDQPMGRRASMLISAFHEELKNQQAEVVKVRRRVKILFCVVVLSWLIMLFF